MATSTVRTVNPQNYTAHGVGFGEDPGQGGPLQVCTKVRLLQEQIPQRVFSEGLRAVYRMRKLQFCQSWICLAALWKNSLQIRSFSTLRIQKSPDVLLALWELDLAQRCSTERSQRAARRPACLAVRSGVKLRRYLISTARIGPSMLPQLAPNFCYLTDLQAQPAS